MNKATKKYLSDCKHELVFTKSYDKRLYKTILSQIEEYLLSHDSVTYEELCNTFGSPSTMAAQSLELFDEKDIIKRTNTYSLHRRSIIIIIIILLLLLGIGVKTYLDIQNIRVITEEITITE